MRTARLRRWMANPSSLNALTIVASFVACGVAWARPGGGGSFSGGGSSGGGGGGGSSGGGGSIGDLLDVIEIVVYVGELTVEYPVVMVPILVACAGYLIYLGNQKPEQKDWTVGAVAPAGSAAPRRTGAPAGRAPVDPNQQIPVDDAAAPSIAAVRELDPDFSRVVFEDFLYALYEKAHAARSPSALAELAPFLAPPVREALVGLHHGATEVNQVVIGAMVVSPLRLFDEGGERWVSADVAWEVNYNEEHASGPQSWYAQERWSLRRKAAARSRRPEAARVFQCPSCGASLEGMRGSTCAHCRQQVDTGDFDWVVCAANVADREPRAPQLTREVAEQGTDLPTLVATQRHEGLQALKARDADFNSAAFERRVKLIFDELQIAWSTRDWTRARPFVSDALFQMELGYINAYLHAHLRNVTENARVDAVVLVKSDTDRYYDSLTVRLYAASLDYTLHDGTGEVACGSRTRERCYSEYWTLIRGVGVAGPARTDKNCPNCGAPLKVNMAGACEYCRARVSCGEFDWVLSQIQQDDSYRG